MMYKYFKILFLTGLINCLRASADALSADALSANAAPPNIIVILADDIGYGDVGCYGATSVQTPNIDRLAKEGQRFTNGYATSATCTPSRYSLMTGEYAFRQSGTAILPGDAALIIKPGRTTLPSVLKKAGYNTAVVGKWHLGLGEAGKPLDWNKSIVPGPCEVGFDYSFIMAATGDRAPCVYIKNHHVVGAMPEDPIYVSYNEEFTSEPNGIKNRSELKLDWSHTHNQAVVNGVGRIGHMKGGQAARWIDEDMADVFTQEAVNFIDREKNNRFFLYFATHDIHVPRVPNKRFVGKTTMGARGDAIVQFDDSVGRILRKLDELNLTSNTLVILSSDNGPVLDDGYNDLAKENLGDHKPAGLLRSGKNSLFEGGSRVPFLTRWPNTIKPGVSSAVVSQVDFLASFAALVGQPTDPRTAQDSLNLLPAFLGKTTRGRSELLIYSHDIAIRKGRWKFIPPGLIYDKLEDGHRQMVAPPGWLIDLDTDVGETNNLAAVHPELLKKLSAELNSRVGVRPPQK